MDGWPRGFDPIPCAVPLLKVNETESVCRIKDKVALVDVGLRAYELLVLGLGGVRLIFAGNTFEKL